VDLAWAYGTDQDTAYIGIRFKSQFVRAAHLETNRQLYSVLAGSLQGYRLLTGQTPVEDVIWHPLKVA
jgi:hypothetical protein